MFDVVTRIQQQESQTSSHSREQILVVPPLECAWLPGDGYTIENSCCMLCFEARGTNDVTILLTSQYGSRRCPWYGTADARMNGYTIIIGSHRNSCVKIEKNGMVVCVVQTPERHGEPMARHPMQLCEYEFRPFWVSYLNGEIRVGRGEDECDCFCVWEDTEPVAGIRYVGLSSWDCHVGYRNVRMLRGNGNDIPSSEEHEALGAPMDTDMCDYGLAVADEKNVTTLSDVCMQTLTSTISLDTVCHVISALDSVYCGDGDILEDFLYFTATHIEDISCEEAYREGFRSLPLSVMERIIEHQAIPCSEMAVYHAVLVWAGGDDAFLSAGPGTPTKDVYTRTKVTQYNSGADSLLPHVRFPLMTLDDLEHIQASSLHVRSTMLQRLVQEALEFHFKPDIDGKCLLDPSISVNGVVDRVLLDQNGSMRFRQRCPRGCTPLVYMYNGDTNGVCHFIGTNYGTQTWVNPVSAGLISVTASSPASRCGTDPKALVDRSFSRVNFAGPRRTQHGTLESWWIIDLGEHHRLRCTRYSLRHDGSSDFLRDWCMQGSLDGESWETLISHTNDHTLKISGQYASWPIRNGGSRSRYRYFKILQTLPNRSAPNPTHVSLSQFDLYGDFFLH